MDANTQISFSRLRTGSGPSPCGQSSDALQYIVREAGTLAKLDVEAHPHMLRYAVGYMLANEGTDTRLIQDFLGHRDIRHTAHYTALSPKRLATVRVR